MSPTFALLVPVKILARAKTRLEVTDAPSRSALMRAFALDALEAALRSPAVSQVYVVSEEPFALEGVTLLPDEGEGDLNRAIVRALERLPRPRPDQGVAAMCADLPCLVDADLTAALSAGDTHLHPTRWFVPDASGTGTTLLAAAPGAVLDPHFGPGSAARHQQSGALAVDAPLPSLRRDVDRVADLEVARALGLGPHSRAAWVAWTAQPAAQSAAQSMGQSMGQSVGQSAASPRPAGTTGPPVI